MKLIIAEKPSLARNIIAGTGEKPQKRDGYYEGNEYITTWAFGHLFSLEDVEHYSPSGDPNGYWSMDNLPCFPEKFDFTLRKDTNGKPDQGVKKQFEIIRSLCCRPDVTEIINAGDADREGEIIVRLIIMHSGCGSKPLKRLWLNDQTAETVAKGLSELKDEREYNNLAYEGFARTCIDWLYGVNLTRYATLRSGRLLRVGRVIVPIVRAIYDRDTEIENFRPEKYFIARSIAETNGEKVELCGKDRFQADKKEECEELCRRYNQAGASVTDVKKKKTVIPPGKLFSLSTLQNMLGKKYKMSMSESLEIIQGLYERGYLTYPRTNSEYLATAEKDKVRGIISGCVKLGYPLRFKDRKNIFDDSKIESHSAITPTGKIPDKSQLKEKEYTVYSTVFRRFAAVFCAQDCTADKTEITISAGGLEDFVLKGLVITEKGWMKYDDGGQKDRILPSLKKGDAVNIMFEPAEKETSPPRHYTIETLNNYLKNPFREEKQKAEEEDDAEDYRAMFEGLELGTEATRTGIIDNARKSGYIKLTKDVYTIESGGRQLIETLGMLDISMDKYKTAEVGKSLKRVYRGECSVRDSLAVAENEIRDIFRPLPADRDIGFFRQIVGKCPVCGRDVVRTPFSYGCSGYRDGCKFSVPLSFAGRGISVDTARELIGNGRTGILCGFTAKSGKKFDAALKIDENRIAFEFDSSALPEQTLESGKTHDGPEK
ncbi:MAG: topoisomerase C-terminal repeat-containing protein [Clostridia bacterium]|nr:topoisomerase C-terminal repeat-containing protein [Clostridia bacterium]